MKPARKHPRLKEYDYAQPGSYFITVCTKDKRCILGRVVGRGDLTPPGILLTPTGKTVLRYTRTIADAYQNITLDRFVIMPNHVHLLLTIHAAGGGVWVTPPYDCANHKGVETPDCAGCRRKHLADFLL